MEPDPGDAQIRPGDAWISKTEREYFVTVIRPAEGSGRWMVLDGGTEREVTADWITSKFMLDPPWGQAPVR